MVSEPKYGAVTAQVKLLLMESFGFELFFAAQHAVKRFCHHITRSGSTLLCHSGSAAGSRTFRPSGRLFFGIVADSKHADVSSAMNALKNNCAAERGAELLKLS
jgi:hypothetical protein